jgi:DGQHR domain-containing protein
MAKDPALVEGSRSIAIPVIRVRQPIGEFYIGTISHSALIDISDFDIRRMLQTSHFSNFVGIQREIDPKRVKEIRQYVETIDATFPTGVILSVREESAELEMVSGLKLDGKTTFPDLAILKLSNVPSDDEETRILYRQIATVIDGQHRIEALKEHAKEDFFINVAIFIGLDKASEAEIFSTVNLAQTKVNKSLVYDLFSYSETRSPEKTCHEVAVVLDSEKESPFSERIKRLGVATEGRFGETLSQATFVKGLLPHITRDPLVDKDLGKRSEIWAKVPPEEFERFVLRPFFVKGQDEVIASIIWNYFGAVQSTWPKAWGSTGTGSILNKTTGYLALMRFFRDAFLNITRKPQMISKEDFQSVLSHSRWKDNDFNKETFVPGSSGQSKLYLSLREDCL